MEVEEKAPEMAAFLFNLLGNQLLACRAIWWDNLDAL
jgi:hypothetical protein